MEIKEIKKCPVCESTKMKKYEGKTVCQRCGYKHIEENQREVEDDVGMGDYS